MIKRLFDIIVSLIGLIVFSPIFLIVAILIKTTSRGPILYKATRVGKNGKNFKMLKFRSMVENADKIGGFSTAGDDPRLTKVGKFLRKYKIDELPQLFNILKGEMSFVGPRPEVPFYIDMMAKEEKDIILSVRPGITDLATLENPHEEKILEGSSDPEKTYQEKIWPEKIRLQLRYVKNRSFLLELKIIVKTIFKIFS